MNISPVSAYRAAQYFKSNSTDNSRLMSNQGGMPYPNTPTEPPKRHRTRKPEGANEIYIHNQINGSGAPDPIIVRPNSNK